MNEIEELILEALREVIIEKGLVDTGKLLNSIRVEINNYNIDIIAEDYFKFLDEKHNITNDLLNSSKYQTAVDMLVEHLIKEQLKEIEDGIN